MRRIRTSQWCNLHPLWWQRQSTSLTNRCVSASGGARAIVPAVCSPRDIRATGVAAMSSGVSGNPSAGDPEAAIRAGKAILSTRATAHGPDVAIGVRGSGEDYLHSELEPARRTGPRGRFSRRPLLTRQPPYQDPWVA